jgi:hypothetical protein
MQNLKSHFAHIDAAWFKGKLAQRGFSLTQQAQRSLPAGKGLWLGIFGR